MAPPDQYGIPCAYIRGGTSKALFFHEKDIPPPGAQRDAVLKRVMGSPDAHQIDGMGGTRTHTSKIAIVRPSMREDADVDFTFAQVGIDQDGVSYKGNCGNISSAVGSFAIDEGLVSVNRTGHSGDSSLKAREVRIYNTNTQKILISHVPVDPDSGLSVTVGNAIIDGVPGRSAPILMDYRNVCKSMIYNPEGRWLVAAKNGRNLLIFHIQTGHWGISRQWAISLDTKSRQGQRRRERSGDHRL